MGAGGVFVARKTSDIAMLLGSRSKSRSRGGIGSRFFGFVDGLLGRAGHRHKERRQQSVSVWVFAIGLLAAFAGGFVVGDKVAGKAAGSDPLRAVGEAPTMINEVDTTPLSNTYFVVSVYPDLPPEEARSKAADLSNYLQQCGLQKARPYLVPLDRGSIWVVAVYFEGDSERAATAQLLQTLPEEVPDEMFVRLRKNERVWPRERTIQ